MVTQAASGEPPVRPYYMPQGVAFDALPEPVRVAFQAVVEPTYRDLVLGVEARSRSLRDSLWCFSCRSKCSTSSSSASS